ncbi:nucleotidyltransferase domain-containing protein [Candidatus Roizmanbacteria bacterium]|nr:nucleotidyltransferase domain-containing protein [Candidatus Roizmanbacteria bacterium]
MGTEKIQSSIKIFVQRVQKKYKPKKVILFGSYARGEANSYSDIDILVVADTFKGTEPFQRVCDLHDLGKDLQPDINAFGYTSTELKANSYKTTLRDALATGIELTA